MTAINTSQATLTDHLKHYFGFDKFKGNQEDIIKSVMNGYDTFVIMPTGGGKSLCYQLPALISDGTAIIVSPLIALMKNQVDSIRSFGTEEGIAHFMNSSLNKTEINLVKTDIQAGRTKMLFVAPETLTKQDNIDFFRGIKVSFVAVDEAHCISEWGHDFRPEYRRIKEMINAIGAKIPIIALTATATPKVQQDIQKNLGMMDAQVYKASFNRANLYYEVRSKKNVNKEIIRYIKSHPGKSGIIYCLSRKKVEEIAESLQVNGIKALAYHAGMDANARASHQDKFLMEEVDVIVATIAFGMGIDKPDVRYVIHHDIPKSLEGYYQETGRGGRDGGEGNCITFYSYKDIEKLEKFLHNKPLAEQEIGKLLLNETVSYTETASCRRKFLLHYFGEQYPDENCGNCDNCNNPKERVEATAEITLLLKTIQSIGEKFKAKHIISFLMGNVTSAIKQYKHHEHDLFGEGSEHDERFWEAALRQSLVDGLLAKEIENYGTIKLGPKAAEFFTNPTPFYVVKDHSYEEIDSEDDIITAQKGSGAADEVLFNMLKDLRRQVAKDKNLPPFVIFQDPSLEDMATQYPITEDELKNITGVGLGKAQKFGKPFLEVIKKYVDENEIDRPQDMVVKSVANKSSHKVYIIQAIDRKLSLEDIAKAKGLSYSDVLSEIESIVDSGTRVNLDYYIEEKVDQYAEDDIIDYFKTSESDSYEVAHKTLGVNDYSLDEVRLMRIKFLSEMGN